MTTPRPLRHCLLFSWLLLSLLFFFNAVQASSPYIQGRIVLTGSIALSNLATFWAQSFNNANPDTNITIADPGSAVGIDALLNGTANAVLISTPLTI